MAPELAQQERRQGVAREVLLRAARAEVVFAPVADGRGRWLDFDLDEHLAFRVHGTHRRDDPKGVANLVRQIDEQPLGVGGADRYSLVVPADDQGTAIGVGEAAEPAQVVVAPGFLPFDEVGFRCHGVGPA